MPLNMVSMAIYVTLEGKIPRTPLKEDRFYVPQIIVSVIRLQLGIRKKWILLSAMLDLGLLSM